MNKAEEQRLETLARKAHDLRECIRTADAMLRSWERHKSERERWVKPEGTNEIYMSLNDRRVGSWHTGVNMPAAVVETELVPILKRIRRACSEELLALPAEIKSR